MPQYTVVAWKNVDDAIEFHEVCQRALFESGTLGAAIWSANKLTGLPREYREFWAVYFLNEEAVRLLGWFGVSFEVLETVQAVPADAGLDFGRPRGEDDCASPRNWHIFQLP